MPLEEYKKKRSFNKTPEPTGGISGDNELRFVVQKHAASHLHYDFRLELKGVLKSWAVPKGPSMNPDDIRLAMQTEDHPYDYKDFEGIIPKGQYGGGTVIVWDEGTYETAAIDEKDKKAQEHSLTGQFYKGEMLVNLHGHKLKGKFALIKDKSKGENAWYIIKVKDTHATKTDVTKKDKSVVSGLTIDEMAANPEARKWQSNRANNIAEEPKAEKTAPKASIKDDRRSPKQPSVEASEDSHWPELEKQPITSSDVFDIKGNQVTLTNVERELWTRIPKAYLIKYYHSVAPYIMPHLIDRPQSLHIKHLKATAPGLYIKDMEGRQPEWAEIFTTQRKHKKRGKRNMIDYLVCNNEATLLYMVNLGCIDINPWTSRTTDYLHPDFIIIDLDPSDDDFEKVIETAKAAKQYFDEHKLKAFPKTSGKTGIHLYLPCSSFTFPEARTIAEHICGEVHRLVPAITTTEVSIAKRGNKLYIDPNQNDEADTVAAPYSVRPFHHPSVSTPLEWKEVNDKLHPLQFDINTILPRLEKKGELFEGVMDKKIAASNTKVLRTLIG